MSKSNELFAIAKELIPGGVNSPVRAFGSVGSEPIFIDRAKGATVTDVDDKTYLDYVGSWGPMILGHNQPTILDSVIKTAQKGLSFGAPCLLEVELARLITEMANIDRVRMVSSGTEAAMSAIRLAKGFTGKDKIIKFEGCYHGHSDSMLIKTGSGVMTMGIPSSAGVSQSVAADTLVADYNNLETVESLFKQHPNQIAAIIIEPVAANMGVVLPEAGFLQGIRELCSTNNALLIFDEVITGFRLSPGGAQKLFNIQADIVTYGKIIGGGMPVGAYGGRKEIMEQIAPLGPVYQAGTLSGNPVAMAAGIAQLTLLKENPQIYTHINSLGAKLASGLRTVAQHLNLPITVNQIGSLCCVFFTQNSVTNFNSANKADTKKYARFFNKMLEQGIYLAPSQFEAMFVSNAHTEQDIARTIKIAEHILDNF